MFLKSIKLSLNHLPHQMSPQKNRTRIQTNRIKESDNSCSILKKAGEINYNNIASNNSNQTTSIHPSRWPVQPNMLKQATTNNNNDTKNSRKMSRTHANANKISKISKIKTNYLNNSVKRLADLKKTEKVNLLKKK